MRDVGQDIWDSLKDETKWCLHYALMHGVNMDFMQYVAPLAIKEPKKTYTLVENTDTSRFMQLAKKMREIWPKGVRVINNREYPWRDTSRNIARKLEVVFRIRDLSKYTDADVLSAARRYVSRFEDDKKYMTNVSYFVLKNDRKDGVIQTKSMLADMLENIYDTEEQLIDEAVFNVEEGEII